MAGHKRKREESEDGDELSFQKQILPVANLPEDFDAPPADGLQYLFMVRRDARYLPHITRVPNPYEMEANSAPPTDDRGIPSHITLPSQEWRTLLETRFKNFRRNAQQRAIGVPSEMPGDAQRFMPDKKERDLWWAYLGGKPESDWNPCRQSKKGSFYKTTVDGAVCDVSPGLRSHESVKSEEGEGDLVMRAHQSGPLPTSTGLPEAPDLNEVASSSGDAGVTENVSPRPREPLPSVLRHIDQQMALHLLMYFTHWINLYVQKRDPTFQPVEAHARWMFALLSKVGDQLSADDMNLLRNVARACIGLLRHLFELPNKREDSDKSTRQGVCMSTRSCWIVICTIAGVWVQRDLWLDAEGVLKTVEP